MKKTVKVKVSGADEATLEVEIAKGDVIERARLFGVGGPDLLMAMQAYRGKLRGKVGELPLPHGTDSGNVLLRELVLRVKDTWKLPYQEQELCHCRAIPTVVVDAAIVMGAHTPDKVSRWTSASTACGTCRKDVQEILKYRLGS